MLCLWCQTAPPATPAFAGPGRASRDPAVAETRRQDKPAEVTVELEEDAPAVKREIDWRQSHSYRFAATTGQYRRFVVEQQGVDLVLNLSGPGGQKIIEADSQVGPCGPESASLVAESSGVFVLEVRLSPLDKGNGGAYELRAEAARVPADEDLKRIAAERLFAEGRRLQREAALEVKPEAALKVRQQAVGKYVEALALWQEIRDRRAEADTLHNIGWTHKQSESLAEAEDFFGRAVALRQELGDGQCAGYTLNEFAAAYRDLNAPEKALDLYARAVSIFRETHDRKGEALALHNTAFTHQRLGDVLTARQFYAKALPLWQAEKHLRMEARTTNNLGGIYDETGEPQQALEAYERAAQVSREIGLYSLLGVALSHTGKVFDRLGEWEEARRRYAEALSFYRDKERCEDPALCREAEAATLVNIGTGYVELNDLDNALDKFGEALSLLRGNNLVKLEGETLSHICHVRSLRGEYESAPACYEPALALSHKAKDARGKSMTLRRMGAALLALNRLPLALEKYQEALRVLKATAIIQGRTQILNELGRAYALAGDEEKSLAHFTEALELCRAVEDRFNEARALYGIALAERRKGQLGEAAGSVGAAIEIVESLRGAVASQRLRASYLASKLDYYELDIDLKMQMHRLQPSAGYDEAALHVSEKSRARNLIESLSADRAGLSEGVEPALVHRRRDLGRKLRAKAAARENLKAQLLNEKTPKRRSALIAEQVATLSKDIAAVATEYDELGMQLHARSPLYNSIARPIGAAEIRRLLDDDSLLLEFALGEERSYVWAVTSADCVGYELPGRKEIEKAAGALIAALTERARAAPAPLSRQAQRAAEGGEPYREHAAALSRILLEKVGNHLSKRRLVIVADGVLQYVPFGVLPAPGKPAGGGDDPLISRHEVVYEPSASVLAALRREAGRRQPASGVLAVFADPVFEGDDTRIHPTEASRRPAPPLPADVRGALTRAGVLGDAGFSRLRASKLEAEEIMSLVPVEKRMVATGFAANLAAATSPELAKYRIIHFATHGLFDDETPELSGLLLSLYDARGRAQDGYLMLHDIYDLRLSAELVVLSACRTGLGKDIRGEGLVGLTRGFMYAGSPRVVASLWKVDSEASYELMSHFYRGMLADGQPPAAALRSAQLAMRRSRRWKSPFYWAGFVLQGEWRGWGESAAKIADGGPGGF